MNSHTPTKIKHPKCPTCGKQEDVVKNGTVRKRQRYRCKKCRLDFIEKTKCRMLEPKFKYFDLKFLAICLYYNGVAPKDVYKYLIRHHVKTIKNEKIVTQWANKILIKPENNFNIKVLNVSKKSIHTKFIKEVERHIDDNDCSLILFPLKAKERKTDLGLLIQQSIRHNIYKKIETKTWLKFLFYLIADNVNDFEFYNLFKINKIDIKKSSVYSDNQIVQKYKYQNFFQGLEVLQRGCLAEFLKKRYRKFCLFLFDSNLKDLHIYIINVTY